MIIDSLWNPKRSKYRHKDGVEDRTLKDGRKFRVYKRYLDKSDIARTLSANQFTIKSLYLGTCSSQSRRRAPDRGRRFSAATPAASRLTAIAPSLTHRLLHLDFVP